MEILICKWCGCEPNVCECVISNFVDPCETQSVKNCTKCEELWQLLDNIDTASDMFKPHDLKSYENFYKYAMNTVVERFKVYESDGFKIFPPKEKS